MKILRVITGMDPRSGGPAQGIRNLTPALVARGMDVGIISCNAPGDTFLEHESLPIIPLGPGRTIWAWTPKLVPWLKSHLSEYDIVIQHGLWQYHGFALRRAMQSLRRRGQPVPRWFIYPHGMLDPWFQRAPERRLKAWRNNVYWWLFERKIVSGADGLLFTCQRELELASEAFSAYRPKQSWNVGYGIPEPVGEQRAHIAAFNDAFPQLNGKRFFLFLSRIHPKKGLDLLLKAYADYRAQLDLEPAPLVIAGPCADVDYWKKLQGLAVELGLQRNKLPFNSGLSTNERTEMPTCVFWPGMLSGDLKWGALRGCHAFLLPSHQENFGIAVVEALCVGTPVVVSREVNIFKEIAGERAGWLVDLKVDSISSVLREVVGLTSRERSERGDRARACYQKFFSVDEAAECLRRRFCFDGIEAAK